MDEEVTESLKDLDKFEAALAEIENHLVPLFSPELPLKEISQQVSHIDNAKLYSGLAYSLNTLFFSKRVHNRPVCWRLTFELAGFRSVSADAGRVSGDSPRQR
jgi:hypothetical protein